MSIVGSDGKPIVIGAEKKKYKVGGYSLESDQSPQQKLQQALEGARELVGQQVYAMTMQQTQDMAAAQAAVLRAMGQVSTPFQIEPCAEAVFMFLVLELEKRDKLIADLEARMGTLEERKRGNPRETPFD